MIILIFGIIVAVIFFLSAKKRELSPVKWGAIGMFGSIGSYLALALIAIAFAKLTGSEMIRAPGYFFIPMSAVIMYLVYRKWLSVARKTK